MAKLQSMHVVPSYKSSADRKAISTDDHENSQGLPKKMGLSKERGSVDYKKLEKGGLK